MATQSFDILIVGTGLSGIYSLYQLRKRFPQWSVQAVEAGSDVGGVWYWNRYPGCQIDTESMSYCYSFDEDLLREWEWKDTFAYQPDTHRYIKRVAEKFDLYRNIQFGVRIRSAHWDDSTHKWTFVDEQGTLYVTRFFVSCLGFLSAPTLPAITGMENFRGTAFHTARWPDDLDLNRGFAGKRIGVIGTGATGIQTITAIAKIPNIASLSVFQRTANWSAPLRNEQISQDQMAQYKTEYENVFRTCAQTPSGFAHQADPRKSCDVTDEDRRELWERQYSLPGFSKWLGVFSDTYTDQQANTLYSAFMADKIRQRVHDPAVAESLIPKNHGYGTRRVPLESGYFEAFNKPHVRLVDLQKTPIDYMYGKGVRTVDGEEHELDILIYATGFDAITGAFNAIEWHGKDDRPLIGASDSTVPPIWPDHRPNTYLGLTIPSMPNTLMILGPHQPFGNATRSIEYSVNFISGLLQFCHDRQITYVEPSLQAAESWTQHVVDCSRGSLINSVDSWMTGINSNVKGKSVRSVARYAGSVHEFKRRCEECERNGYEGFVFDTLERPAIGVECVPSL